MNSMHLDLLAAGLAVVSAFLWACSARVNFQFGFDMDKELAVAMTRASRLNATAASFAAGAAVAQALKTALIGCQVIT
jgi:hypothetical protein